MCVVSGVTHLQKLSVYKMNACQMFAQLYYQYSYIFYFADDW